MCGARETRAMPRTHFLRYVPVDAGALALGYFQVNVAGVGVLVILSYFVALASALITDLSVSRSKVFNVGLSFSWLVISGLWLLLAVALIAGVKKRHPGYVLAYLISGVMTAAVLTLFWMKFIFCDSYYFFDATPLGLLISLFIYVPWLAIVNNLYHNVNLGSDTGHTPYSRVREHTPKDVEKKIPLDAGDPVKDLESKDIAQTPSGV